MNASSRNEQQQENSRSSSKGSTFENQVRRLLRRARKESGGKIIFEEKPRIELANGETRIPDFRLTIVRSYEERHILIECQNRKRSSKPIVEKIHYIRAQHKSQTFIFVYPKRIGTELANRLDGHGVTRLNLGELEDYLGRLTRDVCAHWVTQITNPQHSHDSTAKAEATSETRAVAFHSDPDAERQIDEFLDEPSESPTNARLNGLQRSFGEAESPAP